MTMRSTDQEGSTLIEAMIAMLILAMTLVSVFSAMTAFTSMNDRAQRRSTASIAARARMEELRFTDPETFPTTGTQTTNTVTGEYAFTVVTEYCVTTSYCDDTTRHVVVTIQEDGQDVFETETVFTQLR